MGLKWEMVKKYLRKDAEAVELIKKVLNDGYKNYYLKFLEEEESMNEGIKSTADITKKVEEALNRRRLQEELEEEARALAEVADELY